MSSFGRGLALVIDEDRVEAAIWRNHADATSPGTRIALFDHYRPLARRLASTEFRRTGGGGCERADFEQLAMEGLLQAIDRYDPTRGTPFGAYAAPRIKGCIRNGLAKATEAGAQISHRRRLERDRLRSLRAAADPAGDPLSILAGLTIGIALGSLLEELSGVDPDDLAADDPSAYETVAWNQLLAELDQRLVQLPENEALVLQQHYRNGAPFKQIAQMMGLSQGRISQLHAQGIERLRKRMKNVR